MSAQVSILGNTGRDVELRYTPSGTPVANFSIAANSVRNTPSGQVKKTDWFNVSAFGKQAETLAKYLRKGSSVLVRGRLTFNPWMTDSGEPRVSADVTLQDFEFAGNNSGSVAKVDAGSSAGGNTENDAESGPSSANEVAPDAPFPTGQTPPHLDEPDEEEKAEILASISEIDLTEEIYAGRY
jgi:single-strand DNA-binding protein